MNNILRNRTDSGRKAPRIFYGICITLLASYGLHLIIATALVGLVSYPDTVMDIDVVSPSIIDVIEFTTGVSNTAFESERRVAFGSEFVIGYQRKDHFNMFGRTGASEIGLRWRDSRGWPFRALYSVGRRHDGAEAVVDGGGVTVALPDMDVLVSGVKMQYEVVPLIPLIGPFLGNTLCYAAIPWIWIIRRSNTER